VKSLEEHVILELENGVATILLNAPNSLNALSQQVKTTLMEKLTEVEQDPSINVVILTGKGRAFCAGGDVKGMGEKSAPIQNKERLDNSGAIVKRIYNLKKPVISAVHGHAAGAGFSLALAADIVVAEESAKFTLSFKNISLVPDMGLHYFLSKTITPWKLKELIWKGARISAQEGETFGFVNVVAPDGEGYIKAKQIAEEITSGPIKAYTFSKGILNSRSVLDLDSVLEFEGFAQSVLKETEDHKEGVLAFKEKRSPSFKGY
jgi:2-(1,2-epoxy-1,2-dihydrophenyl)acetyl-CoA isomerase